MNTKMYKNYFSRLFIIAVAVIFLMIHATAQAADIPTLQITAFGLNQVQIYVTGADPNASAILYYSTGTYSSSVNLGITNSAGGLSVVEDSDLYDLSSGGQFYISVDGAVSPVIYYPSSAAPGTFSLNATSTTLSVGESVRLTSSVDGSAVSSNTNPSVADAASGPGVVVVNGDNPGTTIMTLCVSNTNCTTLNVIVQGTSANQTVVASPTAPVVSTQCVNLLANLYEGLTDSKTNGRVTILQDFLAREGYLSATPNGHFGPATFTAVEKFQMASGIAAVGEAGPTTRAAIERLTCNVSTATSAASASTLAPVTSAIPTATVTTSSGTTVISTTPTISSTTTITAISTGATLGEGQTLTLQWNGQAGVNYTISLEDQYGAGQGFIASNLNTNQYVWTVGSVYTNGVGYQTVSPGTYRIHVENAATGVSASDQISGLFTLAPAQLDITYAIPSSIPADGKTSAVLYGTGFNVNTQVVLNAPTISENISPAYVSPDGTVLVCTIPPTVPAGEYTIGAINTFSNSTSTVSVRSNTMTVGVTQ